MRMDPTNGRRCFKAGGFRSSGYGYGAIVWAVSTILLSSGGFLAGQEAASRSMLAEPADTNDRQEALWQPERNCRIVRTGGIDRIEAVGGQPSLYHRFNFTCEKLEYKIQVRTKVESNAVFHWVTRQSPRRGDDKSVTIPLIADGEWHEYNLSLPVYGNLTGLSLRLSAPAGLWELDAFALRRRVPQPLVLDRVVPSDDPALPKVEFTLLNTSPSTVQYKVHGLNRELSLEPNRRIKMRAPLKNNGALAEAQLSLTVQNLPPITYPVFLYRPEVAVDWISLPLDGHRDKPFSERSESAAQTDFPLTPSTAFQTVAVETPSALPSVGLFLDIAPNAGVARVRSGETILAWLAPLVHRQGTIPAFQRVQTTAESGTSGTEVRFEAPDTDLSIRVHEGLVHFRAGNRARQSETAPATASLAPLEGPVVRPLGTLRGAVLCGVEFLGPNDVSSGTIDLAEPYNRRFEPDPRWLTMPLAAIATDRVAATMLWHDTALGPTFAVPNVIDGTDDHRMGLRGGLIESTLRFVPATEPDTAEPLSADADPIVASLLWGMLYRGPVDSPASPRGEKEQSALILQAFEGALLGEDKLSWGYAADSDWPRQSFADVISVLWRLNGRLPRFGPLTRGGSDIADEAVYFLVGKTAVWRDVMIADSESLRRQMQPDGSFPTRSRFPDVEQTTTSPGYCALKALQMMEWVRYSGDRNLFADVEKTLLFLDRFEVPRGAFPREMPLHTPDLLSAAYLSWLYTWAYEFSGKRIYLAKARNWAIRGLAFVYFWEDIGKEEIMRYVTVPKFGGVDREPPLWYATSQPRIGLSYAYALTLLARYDTMLEWNDIARGILTAVEQMQFTDGPATGCFPERFQIDTQQRDGWKIGPCALATLRLTLSGRPAALHVIADAKDRIVSPYPGVLNREGVEIHGVPAGSAFELLQNGKTILSGIGSGTGKDQLKLE